MTKLALAVGAAVLALAGQAAAQDFQPKEKGPWMLNLRVSGVLTDAEDPIVTAAGADTGLKAKVGDDVMPALGLTYFLTDHVAVEAIAGTTRHEVKAVGTGTDVTVHKLLVLVFGAHMPVVEPAAVLPMPSRDVPVPRLMI